MERTRAGFGLALVGLLAVGRAAGAATFLHLDSDASDSVGAGRRLRLEPPVYVVTAARRADLSVTVTLTLAGQLQPAWQLTFAPPLGTALTAGVYEDARGWPDQPPAAPGLAIAGERSCSRLRGRFEVLAADYGAAGEVLSLAVDFEQHCESALPGLRGALRFRAGDVDCGESPDGSPCDDRDACTPAARCAARSCVGTSARTCAPATDDCHDAGVCDPRSDACLPPSPKPDGAACDDGDACTLYETCQDAACRGLIDAYCEGDRDPCTLDVCDPRRGCVHEPVAGTCGRPGRASTLLFLRSEAGDPVGNGTHRSLTPAEGAFTAASDDDGAAHLTFVTHDFGESWYLNFYPPAGARLAPGAYENVPHWRTSAPDPGVLNVSSGGSGYCPDASGRFVVLEARYGPGGTLVSFAADFEQRCAAAPGALVGAIRFRSGDADCASAPDGAPCENHDRCAAPASCQAGACVGIATVTCAPADACHDAAACDPESGACLAAVARLDGTACTDVAGCVPSGSCAAGACTGETPACDDADVCTDDACDGTGGCMATPIAGSCWALRARTTVVAQYQGRACTCRLPATRGALALGAGGSYRTPGGLASCPAGGTLRIPDEVGIARPGKRGRLVLEPGNDGELRALAAACTGGAEQVTSSRRWVKVSPDGARLRGLARARGRALGSRVVVQTVTRVTGRRTATAAGIEEADVTRGLERCTRTLAACFAAPY